MKKSLITILIIFLLITAIVLGVIFFKNKGASTGIKKNNPEIEKLISFNQSEVSSFVFVTQESTNNHVLNLNLSPFLTLGVEGKEIESFDISNFKATNSGKKEVILIHPTDLAINTLSRTFLFTAQDSINQKDLKASENSINYKVVNEVKNFNEVASKDIVTPHFGIIIKNIGTVDYESILKRDGVFDGTKYLEYSKISLDDLNTNIQFDINIKFTDGKKYSKRLSIDIKGESFKTETTPIFPITPVE